MLKPQLVTAPATAPIDLDDAKAQCRIDSADEDILVRALVEAATTHLDGWAGILGRCLVTQTWRQDFSGFAPCLRLPIGPVQSIASVKYYDGDQVLQTVEESVYALRTDELGSYVEPAPDQSWPGTYSRPDAVQVSFVAGYGAAKDVPQPIRHAIRLLVGHWYLNREAIGGSMAELPMGVDALIRPYRRVGP